MADRHTTQALQTERAPRTFLRSAARGVALPLLATGLIAGVLAPGAGSPAGAIDQLTPAASKLPPFRIIDGEQLRPAYVNPVRGGYRTTAEYGDGGGHWAHGHTGLDFAAPEGRVVRAITRGVVVSAEYDGSYGNKVVVRLASGTQLWFCHLSEIHVQPGDEVSTGTHLGEVGSTGNSTGPHLHLEVRPGEDSPIDPAEWLEERGVTS